MIYAGILHFKGKSDVARYLGPALEHYTDSPPLSIEKESVSLCYGKLSELQDKDEIWEDRSAFLMGRVFDKQKEASLQQQDFEKLLKRGTERFFQDVWGKYIFLQDHPEEKAFKIIIDPTGQLPFFYYVFPRGDILFSSDIEIIFKILKKKPEFNWTYLCSYFVYGNSSAIQTPFKDIYELPPGCSLHVTQHNRVTKPFWNPLNSYTSPHSEKKDAVGTLQSTLKPWIEPYQTICVSLSGGLDSSSLVYCLKDLVRRDQTLMALNYFHSNVKSSNELVHARQVCKEAEIKLIELNLSNNLPFDPNYQKCQLKPNKPFPGLISLKCMQNIMLQASFEGASTFLSGHGSDHIFMRPPSPKSVSDYIIEKGFRGAKKKFNSITDFFRDSAYSILKDNIKELMHYYFALSHIKRCSKEAQKEYPGWVKEKITKHASVDFVHPIYSTLSSRIPPGKYAQVDFFYEGLASIHMELNPLFPTYYPYLSQPIVEFALSFSTYDLLKDGYDRYPLRKAVSDRFKTNVIWRRDKSQTTGIFQLGLKKNLDYVLSICGEGDFVKNDFVNKEGVKYAIKSIANGDINHIWPFIRLVSNEIFLQHWNNKF